MAPLLKLLLHWQYCKSALLCLVSPLVVMGTSLLRSPTLCAVQAKAASWYWMVCLSLARVLPAYTEPMGGHLTSRARFLIIPHACNHTQDLSPTNAKYYNYLYSGQTQARPDTCLKKSISHVSLL